MAEPDDVLTVQQVARLLCVRSSLLYLWRNRGEGPVSFKSKHRVLYKREDVERWIEARRAVPTVAAGSSDRLRLVR